MPRAEPQSPLATELMSQSGQEGVLLESLLEQVPVRGPIEQKHAHGAAPRPDCVQAAKSADGRATQGLAAEVAGGTRRGYVCLRKCGAYQQGKLLIGNNQCVPNSVVKCERAGSGHQMGLDMAVHVQCAAVWPKLQRDGLGGRQQYLVFAPREGRGGKDPNLPIVVPSIVAGLPVED